MEEEIRRTGGRGWRFVERLLLALTFGCFVVMAVVIAAVSLKKLHEESGGWVEAAGLFLPCLAIAGLAALCRRAGPGTGRRFALALFLAALALKGAFASVVDTQPVSDFQMMYETAQWLARDGPRYAPLPALEYFQRWPYQSWFVAYMAVLIRLFGADVLFFKLTNALCAALTSVLVYALARRFSSEGGARLAALLYTFYPGTWLLVPVLTNQHLSELLLLLAVFLYTAPAEGREKRLCLAGAAGAVLALSNAFRPAAVVALAAAGCLMVLELLRERRGGGWRAAGAALARFALLAGMYASLMWGFGQAIRLTGVNEYGLSSSCPEWKFVCGLNEETCGGYSKRDAALVFGSEDPRQAARELVLQRLSVPPDRLAKLAWDKVEKLWGGCESLEWTFTPNVAREIDKTLPMGVEKLTHGIQRLSSGCYVWCFLLIAAGGCFALRGGTGRREAAQLLALAALAYFGVHLLIEVQVRYRSLMYAVAFPLAAPGLDGLLALWDGRTVGGKPLKTLETEN